MPRRRKRRPVPTEQEKLPTSFFQSEKKKEESFFPATTKQLQNKKYTALKSKTLNLLDNLYNTISESHVEEGGKIQGKTLELANKILATDISNIDVIKDAIHRISQSILYASRTEQIRFMENSCNLHHSQQERHFLEASIQASHLPDLEGAPSHETSVEQSEKLWADYIYKLAQLLPEGPLVITGTPINKNYEEDDDSVIPIVLSNFLSRIRNLLNS